MQEDKEIERVKERILTKEINKRIFFFQIDGAFLNKIMMCLLFISYMKQSRDNKKSLEVSEYVHQTNLLDFNWTDTRYRRRGTGATRQNEMDYETSRRGCQRLHSDMTNTTNKVVTISKMLI